MRELFAVIDDHTKPATDLKLPVSIELLAAQIQAVDNVFQGHSSGPCYLLLGVGSCAFLSTPRKTTEMFGLLPCKLKIITCEQIVFQLRNLAWLSSSSQTRPLPNAGSVLSSGTPWSPLVLKAWRKLTWLTGCGAPRTSSITGMVILLPGTTCRTQWTCLPCIRTGGDCKSPRIATASGEHHMPLLTTTT